MIEPSLPLFRKLPLGGVDRRMLVPMLAERGPEVARQLLAAERSSLQSANAEIGPDEIVLLLGGSNGLTRAIAVQLLFGEHAAVFAVHYDSEKMQIGPHHARALTEAAAEQGTYARFINADAAKPETVAQVVAEIRERFRVVHLVNGIAAGAPKRHERFGPTRVRELDVAFDPVLQVPDFTRPENVRRLGLVDVEVATAADVERTHRYMGASTWLWAEALARAGLLGAERSLVAFCDYDFPPDDPVYGMGPLADAKRAQRESLERIATSFGARVARICYPAMATTALGAIPGGLFLYD
jgi:enoyl-[acyl-carrier protein] reductase/trans-2-enoyl-CoA reductase (NAD+)